MTSLIERETQVGKIKYHINQHAPKDGKVLLEFRRFDGVGIPFSVTVHESQVDEEIQRFQEWQRKKEELDQEIVRFVHGDK